jgi:HK97 family phage major capsid protein
MAGELEKMNEALEGINSGFVDLKDEMKKHDVEIKKFGEARADTKQFLDRVEETIKTHEDEYKKFEVALKSAQDERKSTQERIDELETRLNRPLDPGMTRAAADVEEAKALRENLFRFMVKKIGHQNGAYSSVRISDNEQKAFETYRESMEAKALNVGTDTAGGFTVPEDYRVEMLKTITEWSPLRRYARVEQTSRDAVKWPKRTGQFAAVWVSETGTRSETTGLTFGLEDVPVHELYALVDISEQLLEDSAFNMEQFLRLEASEQFAVAEGAAFISGNGIGKPEGITTAQGNGALSSTNSGHATQITADGLIALFYDQKEAYANTSTWLWKRATTGVIRRLKDGNGQYLWQPAISAGTPGTVLAQPFVESVDMTGPTSGVTYASSAKPVAFGDWRRNYIVLDRVGMSMLRDPFTQATSGNVRFIFRKRVGGQVILSEAARLLNISA